MKALTEIIERGLEQAVAEGKKPTRVVLGKIEYRRFQEENRRLYKQQLEGDLVSITNLEKSYSALVVEGELSNGIKVEYENAGSLQV